MPTPRIVLSTDGLVISRPGFDASNPSLADANKVFDSDWAFGGAIVKIGFATFTDLTRQQAGTVLPPLVIDFPEQPSPPAVLVYKCWPPETPTIFNSPSEDPTPIGGYRTMGIAQAYYRNSPDSDYVYDITTVTNNQIIIPSWSARSSGWFLQHSWLESYSLSWAEYSSSIYRRGFLYIVFGV